MDSIFSSPPGPREPAFAGELRRGLSTSARLYQRQAQAARDMAELTRKHRDDAVSLFRRLSAQAYPVPVASPR